MYKKILLVLFSSLLISGWAQMPQKRNILKLGGDAIYFPDWNGYHPFQIRKCQEFDRYVFKQLYVAFSHESISIGHVWIPMNIPKVIDYRKYTYWGIGLGYSFFVSSNKKYKLNIQAMYAQRKRIISVREWDSFTGVMWEGEGLGIWSTTKGITPSLHFIYTPIKWIDVNIDIAYGIYKRDSQAAYLQKENNLLMGASLGFKFGKDH